MLNQPNILGVGANGQRIPTPAEIAAAQNQAVAQLRTNLYLGLIPVVAAKLLERDESWMERDIGEDVAVKANQITLAAMRKMGINIVEQPTEQGESQ